MANVIITLPEELWVKIVKREKQYELRKSYPRNFSINDRVYVIIKGTTNVAGWFSVDSIWLTDDYAMLWKYFGRYLCISYDWFCEYVYTVKKKVYMWRISSVYRNTVDMKLVDYFGIRHNPQSYVYTELTPDVQGYISWCSYDTQKIINRTDKPLIPYPII